ncbi:hypothetical protein [Halostella pelagica]|uniref:hypothetical protein n=1 Tax=Halostella pelagica TaxID=2583824 RepID=UPI001081E3BE|nr:hypothetical protein [Halostella pelagica]
MVSDTRTWMPVRRDRTPHRRAPSGDGRPVDDDYARNRDCASASAVVAMTPPPNPSPVVAASSARRNVTTVTSPSTNAAVRTESGTLSNADCRRGFASIAVSAAPVAAPAAANATGRDATCCALA